MTRQRVWRKIATFLALGLELPALVLFGLYVSSVTTTGWKEPWRTVAVLSSSVGCYALGTFIIWWAALRIYRQQTKPP